MFPLRDENPTLRTPIATLAIIAANASVWLWVQGLGAEPQLSSSVCSWGLISGELLGLAPAGTRVPLSAHATCVLSGSPNWLTPLTSMFLHGSWFHIVGNLWFLWVFGDNVEDAMGRRRFVVFYLLCGLAAAGSQMGVNPTTSVPMVGASGAIGGVMGAYAVLYPRARVHMLLFFGFFFRTVPVPAYFMLGYWLLLQLLGGIPTLRGDSAGVAFWAHLGGFGAGAVLVFPFRDSRLVAQQRRAARARGRVV